MILGGMRARATGLTHEGLVRKANEDSLILRDDIGLWAVADGMGGHANGQRASGLIVETLAAAPPVAAFDDAAEAIGQAIHVANQRIYSESRALGASMGSTVVALLIHDRRFACLWAGDSRIYLFRDKQLYRLTRDHTQVQDMVEAGLLKPEEARRHPMGHVLSRAVGVQDELELEAFSDEVEPKDVFLLCSDGLTGLLSDGEIAERLAAFEPQTACQRMLDLVLSRGAHDNVTMVAVACEETTSLTFAAEPV